MEERLLRAIHVHGGALPISKEGRLIIVSAHLSASFPSGPVNLRYRFALEGERIAQLEVVYMIPLLILARKRALITSNTRGADTATVELFRGLGAHVPNSARTTPASFPGELFAAADLATLEAAALVGRRVSA